MHEPMRGVARALSIAGSDSGGGAGIQADLKTFSALGVYGMTAITAVTVQNTLGVSNYQAVDPAIVGDQIRAVADDIGVDAAKTGMLASASIVRAAASAIRETEIRRNLVVDPVFVSKHGDPLLEQDAVAALRDELLPLAALATPNLPEAGGLLGRVVERREDMEAAARDLLELGASAVLVKGGHLPGDVAADLFMNAEGSHWLESPRIDTPHTHGTGCTLSAAITAELARGAPLEHAVERGKAFVTRSIEHGLALGAGVGPTNPLWATLGNELPEVD